MSETVVKVITSIGKAVCLVGFLVYAVQASNAHSAGNMGEAAYFAAKQILWVACLIYLSID